MAEWDVFHSDRLEAERSLTTEDVRAAMARGDLVGDDLIRPSGSTRWARLGDLDEFARPAPPAPGEPMEFAPPSIDDDFEDEASESDISRFEFDPSLDAPLDREDLARIEFDDEEPPPTVAPTPSDRPPSSLVAMAAEPEELTARADLDDLELDFDELDPQDEDDEAAEFTLSRNAPERVEELDLAAMVNVAFQLVLFFLVTTATVVFKTLEVPRPNEDRPPEAAAQARVRSIDELEKDYILVEIDAAGALKVNRQPVPADRSTLAERLRAARQATGRKAMLLSADFATRHENAVLAFDVANEVDLSIAVAQPTGKK